MTSNWRSAPLMLAAVIVVAGAFSPRHDLAAGKSMRAAEVAESDRAAAARTAGRLDRATSNSGQRAIPEARTQGATAGSAPQIEPAPPVQGKPDALARAGAPVPASANQTLRACPPGAARPDCRYAGLQEALAAASAGDHVVLAPGVYEEGAVVATPDLVLRAEPGAHLRGHAVEGKAALVIKADGVVIDGIECSGVAVRDNNGACIRIEGDDLTVRNVHFHDNQEGILSGPGGGVLLVEDSLLERNGFGGLAHGIYVGPTVATFIFRHNRILATTGAGHGLKSRAQKTVIEGNIIAGLDGHDSRAIDVPNGGEVVIRGNLLEKGPNSDNGQMIGLALEGGLHDANETLIEGNLIVFDTLPRGLIQELARTVGLLPPKGTVIASESPGRVVLRNNVIVGALAIGGGVIEEDNRTYRSRRAAGLPPYPALPEVSR
jgi:hypothetical protein